MIPRPFTLHWGRGQIAEEASVACQYHEPSLQLLEYEDGSLSVRFCYYHGGRFQRSPLIMGSDETMALRDEIRKCPRLHDFLKKLLSD